MSFELLLSFGWAILVLVAWVFLSVGSFLNVVIYRLPVMLDREWRSEARSMFHISEPTDDAEPFNLLTPRSRCPNCLHLISAWQNIPIVSWLVLRGRCGNCRNPISVRYPAIELATLLMSIVVLGAWGYQWLTVALLFYTWSLIALTLIDYDTMLLPDQITVPLLWVGLFTALTVGEIPLSTAVIGAMAGYLSLWSIYWAFKLLTGKEGMGYGDFKLVAALGAWLGWQALPGIILVASVSGLAFAALSMVLKRLRPRRADPVRPVSRDGGLGYPSLPRRDRSHLS